MYMHRLTVIAGGNSDDNYAETHRGHLKLVEHTPTPSVSADSGSYPFILTVLDGAIELTAQFLFTLGAFRTRIARTAPDEAATGTDVRKGRGW